MIYIYWLPDEQGQKKDYSTEENAVIIIGANGSGKSKLGAWIEQQDLKNVHRISAQRNLTFQENIPLKSFSEAQNWVFFGNADGKDIEKRQRWNWGHYTTHLISDFDNVLAALIAKRNNEATKFLNDCKAVGDDKSKWPDTRMTSIDKLECIWNLVFPQRDIIENDAKFFAKFYKDEQEVMYSATEMSDGERAVLYLAAQVLCVPENKILIIDEPEVHLHRSIMNRLWKALESFRTDCLFIYITHDLQFAAAHGNVPKYWIKEFDGTIWKFEELNVEELPEELITEILGSRKKVLFVEGEKSSYDYQLYIQLYPNYHIIPCGSCSQVITRTKAFRSSRILHDCTVYGLIDRDYRSEHEILSLAKDNIFVLSVAEVENLFLVEELVRFMADKLAVSDIEQTVQKVKDFVIKTKFTTMINKQICQSVVSEIKYQLSRIEISQKNETEAKSTLQAGWYAIKYDEIKTSRERQFTDILAASNYSAVLRVFNEKGTVAEIGTILGIDKRKYQEKVINFLRKDYHDDIVNILLPYLPSEIPR